MVATPLFYLKKNYSFVRHPRREPGCDNTITHQ